LDVEIIEPDLPGIAFRRASYTPADSALTFDFTPGKFNESLNSERESTLGNSRSVFVLGLTLLLILAPVPAAHSGEIPEILPWDKPEDPPVFVRADVLFTAKGKLNASLLAEHDATTIRSYLRLPKENGCIRLMPSIPFGNDTGPYRNVREATALSKRMVRATVTSLATGFRGSDAGTLLELDPIETLKGEHLQGRPYYVFFPTGNFKAGGKSICALAHDYPSLPVKGDQVVLFLRNSAHLIGSYIPLMDGTDVIVIRKDSGLELPRYFRADQKLQQISENDLLGLLRAQISEEQQP
jgi:hypothetical protein